MKKLISILLAIAMLAVLAAGCGQTGNNGSDKEQTTAATTTEPIVVPESALEVLNNTWAAYAEQDKFFAMGGDMNNMVDNAPGAYSIEDTDGLSYTLLVPAEQIANIDEAASLVHAMNLNTFTCGVFHVVPGADATAFAAAMRDSVQGNQWMCGFPEKVVVAVIGGEYVLCAFGVNDAMNPFQTYLMEAYPQAVIAYDEAVTG